MLDGGNEQAIERTLIRGLLNERRQRQCIRFSTARGEDHIARISADQRRNLLARLLDRAARHAAFAVHRRRVSGQLMRCDKRLPRFRAEGRTGVPVEINTRGH